MATFICLKIIVIEIDALKEKKIIVNKREKKTIDKEISILMNEIKE